MKIQTFSIIVGGMACNAHCPFCVSRMTGKMDSYSSSDVNWRNLDIACRLAVQAGATTAMLTGKGEPTLYPDLITEYLKAVHNYFPLIELQTNGLLLGSKIDTNLLTEWYRLGLTTVAISVCHFNPKVNAKIYLGDEDKDYPDLQNTIKLLHDVGFSVRLCCVGIKGFLDSFTFLSLMSLQMCRWEVEQLTFIPVNMPQTSVSDKIYNWVKEHKLSSYDIKKLVKQMDKHASRIMVLDHGAIVYDLNGQNICISNCLQQSPSDLDRMRNLIFFNDGHLRYKWDKKGSIIL